MGKQLVLVTGATGHIGFRTLVEVVKAGYRARVTTRKIAQVEKIKAAKSIQPYLDDIEYEEVPDITVEGAFDKALKGVDFVLHVASPIPDLEGEKDGNFDVKKTYLEPARAGTLSILKSAHKTPSIKRVVITSSVAILAYPDSPDGMMTADKLAPIPDPDDVPAQSWVAYRASKILAFHATQEWVSQNKPSWDLLHVLPGYAQGRNELVSRVEDVSNGSNDVMIEMVSGKVPEVPRPSILVLVDDVAKVEVAALDLTKGKNGDLFLATYPHKVEWTDVLPVVAKIFPDAVKSGVLSLDSKQESIPLVGDSSPATNVLGVEFHGLETMVSSLVGQYLELKA